MTDTWAATTEPAPATVPDYPMPRAQGCPFDPPSELQALQEQRLLARGRLWDGSTPWLVTRYADQRALLADSRVSADFTRPGFPRQWPDVPCQSLSFISIDDPEHSHLRTEVTSHFATT